jgi:hypothetical protein
MGLDMYLSAKKHVSNYDFYPEEKELNKNVKEVLGLQSLSDDNASVTVSVNVGYWRKSNQIHNWFVTNCQGGKDDCGEYWVGRDDLQELLDTVTEVLATRKTSKLPPVEGFFFGSKNVDEWYWDDLEHTASMLSNILNNDALNGYQFYYQSSW